jgi:hypothetical protein
MADKRLNNVARLARERDVEVECYTFDLSGKEDIDDFWGKIDGGKIFLCLAS